MIKTFEYTLLDNSKLKPIKGVMFEDALNCSSEKNNLCGLCGICYARRDAKQHQAHHQNTLKAAAAFNKIFEDKNTLKKYVQYLNINNFKVIRFNLVGDFTTQQSINNLERLAAAAPQIKFYGYSKRADLDFKDLIMLDNIYLNSNLKKIYKLKGCNQYKTTTNIKEYYNSKNKCGGVCSGCGHCYTLRDEKINTFIHSTPSHLQKWIKNTKNNEFLINFINQKLDLNATVEDIGGGYYVNSFIELLNNKGVNTPTKTTRNGEVKQLIKTVPDLLKFIELEVLLNE